MKLTVVHSVSNDGSRKLVRSSNHSIRCHPRSSSFRSNNLHVVSSKISTFPGVVRFAGFRDSSFRGRVFSNIHHKGLFLRLLSFI